MTLKSAPFLLFEIYILLKDSALQTFGDFAIFSAKVSFLQNYAILRAFPYRRFNNLAM